MTFSAVAFEDVKPNAQDRVVLGISDRNTQLFNDKSMTRLANQLKEKGWKKIDVLPSGSLQRHSEELAQLIKKGKTNLDKALKDALQDELQTTNKCLSAFIYSGMSNIGYWKPKKDIRNTPKPKDLGIHIEKSVEQLKALCEKEKVSIVIDRLNGFYKVDVDANEAIPVTVTQAISQLNQLTRNAMRLAVTQISWIQSHTKSGKSNTSYFDRYFDSVTRTNESKGDSIRVEVTQWASVVLNPHPAYEETKQSPKILNCLREGTNEHFRLEELVSKLTEKRLKDLHQKYQLDGLVESFVKVKHAMAAKYTREYLLEEIIYFQMLIDNAVKQYELSPDPVKPCVYLAYPMNNPKDLSGRYVFEFMWSINKDIFEGKYQEAFRFLDTYNVMKKEEMKKTCEVTPSVIFPALPAPARPASDIKDEIKVSSGQQKASVKKKKLESMLPHISRMYTPPAPKIPKRIQVKFSTPPCRVSQVFCSQFSLSSSQREKSVHISGKIKMRTHS